MLQCWGCVLHWKTLSNRQGSVSSALILSASAVYISLPTASSGPVWDVSTWFSCSLTVLLSQRHWPAVRGSPHEQSLWFCFVLLLAIADWRGDAYGLAILSCSKRGASKVAQEKSSNCLQGVVLWKQRGDRSASHLGTCDFLLLIWVHCKHFNQKSRAFQGPACCCVAVSAHSSHNV